MFTLFMHRTPILDFHIGAGEVLLTFRVENPTSGVIAVKISDWELGTSEYN